MFHTVWSLPYDTGEEKQDLAAEIDSALNLRQQRSDYQNEFDERLYENCHDGFGVFHVKSEHDNDKEDRRWLWECRELVHKPEDHCYWTSYKNDFDRPLTFSCDANEFVGGVESLHDDQYEDRIWKFKCCKIGGYITRSCFTTGYENEYDGPMDYEADYGYVITGAESTHNNGKE